VAFKANWEPKAENIRQIAAELNLGVDSIVFVDDNPAEIEIVRQFVPEAVTILLGPDPSEYVAQLQDCRFFEPLRITSEDAQRTAQYQSNNHRRVLLESVTDMDAYLESLAIEAEIREFNPLDVPRLAQLINKSNQFNLTTRRRSEAEVQALISSPTFVSYSVRLKDRFGDHGLISIVIAEQTETILAVDTWLMSCRVLKRQVEDEVLNELARLAQLRGCNVIKGLYLRTPKNDMVRDFYSRMGFTLVAESDQSRGFELSVANFQPHLTRINVIRHAYEPS
jgi:FkbH-like protein